MKIKNANWLSVDDDFNDSLGTGDASDYDAGGRRSRGGTTTINEEELGPTRGRGSSASSSGTRSGMGSPRGLMSPFLKEYAVTAEYNLYINQQLPGVYVIPSSRNPYEWLGVLFLRQGLYQGAILRFALLIPDSFPDTSDCPKLTFDYPVFHPHVAPETGELDIKRAFPVWRKNVHHCYQVLVYMQRVFYRIETQEPSNEIAARSYESEPEQFRLKVAESVRRTRETVYDPPDSSDPHAIRFSPWDTGVHERIRTNIFKYLRLPFYQEYRIACEAEAVANAANNSNQENSVGQPPTTPQFPPASSYLVMNSASDSSIVTASEEADNDADQAGMRGFPQNAQTSGLSWFDPLTLSAVARDVSTSAVRFKPVKAVEKLDKLAVEKFGSTPPVRSNQTTTNAISVPNILGDNSDALLSKDEAKVVDQSSGDSEKNDEENGS